VQRKVRPALWVVPAWAKLELVWMVAALENGQVKRSNSLK
jgi:hypothetical protein